VSLGGIKNSSTAYTSKSQMKKMFITFFDIKITVHFEGIERGQTINEDCYVKY